MEPSVLSVRSQMAAASKRIGRLRRVDRAAVVIITLGGLAVVVAVLGILVFVASEALPLFSSATLTPRGEIQIATALSPANASSLRAVGVDEYQKRLHGRAHRSVAYRSTQARATPDRGGQDFRLASRPASATGAPR